MAKKKEATSEQITADDVRELIKNARKDGVKVDITGMDISGASLVGVDMRAANASGAKLSGVDFTGANLEGVNFSGANLEGANFSAACLRFSVLPNGFASMVASGAVITDTTTDIRESVEVR